MKLEIEISEDEIKKAIQRKVKFALEDKANEWTTDAYIRDQIKAKFNSAIDALISEELNNSVVLKEKIQNEIEKELRAQLNKVLAKVIATNSEDLT